MKTLISTLLIFLAAQAQAKENSGQSYDRGSVDASREISPHELRDRFQLFGDVLIFSPDGERLTREGGERRQWSMPGGDKPLVSNWKYTSRGEGITFTVRHEWKMSEDGKITVHLEQFESIDSDHEIKFGKKIKDETFTLKDFAGVNFVVESNDKRKVVARFIPKLEERRNSIEPSDFPIVIEDGVAIDKKGNVWASGFGGSGKYVGIRTVHGTFAMSLFPFKGAAEIGYAQDSQIHLATNDESLTVYSSSLLVPHKQRAKIYGLIDDKKKGDKGSIGTSWGDKEAGFVEELGK